MNAKRKLSEKIQKKLFDRRKKFRHNLLVAIRTKLSFFIKELRLPLPCWVAG